MDFLRSWNMVMENRDTWIDMKFSSSDIFLNQM